MRKLLWATFGVALISMVFAGCKKDEPTYMVQVTATEGGTVEGQSGEYKEGETVVFTAVPAEGYYFTKWSDGNTNNPRTITIRKELTITAEFAQKPLLTISASNNGTIETDVNGRYAPGSSVTVTAKPDDGCFFMGWDDGYTENTRTIVLGTNDTCLVALFFAPAVDLGLESGILWTSRNLGATVPWDRGDYYAWGETEPIDNNNFETYKYCKGSYNTITKYCNNAEFGFNGFTDDLTTLLPEDDAATTVLGSDYSMPTVADWEELCSQCYWVWTDNYNNQNVDDSHGYIVYKAKDVVDKGKHKGTPSASYSLTDTHIFLPAAGGLYKADYYYGRYFSSSLYEDDPSMARTCGFKNGEVDWSDSNTRSVGHCVRPVRRK